MWDLFIRKACLDDAESISEVLQEIAAAGKRRKSSDPAFVIAHYLIDRDQIQCTVALSGTHVLGFQSLKRAVEGNPYGAPVGWGVIGTHIRPLAARKGVGRALFQTSLAIAKGQAIPAIDATIAPTNAEGLAYYSAMGFIDYRSQNGAVCKFFSVE